MGTMDSSLPKSLREWVASQVDGGLYADGDDYIRHLIRDDRTKRRNDERQLEELKDKIALGLADVEAGRVVDAEEVFDRLEARYEAMIAEREAG